MEEQPLTRQVRSVCENKPGDRWATIFNEFYPAYEKWFLAEGEIRRPTYLASRRMIRYYMPEFLDLYDQLVELGGGTDRVARLLSLYRPTPFMTGCSQVVWTGEEPILIRNYDYAPNLWESLFWKSKWVKKQVIWTCDCLWGALDGINEDGLVLSLCFGGRKIQGDGFGIPLVLRYILEMCSNCDEAIEHLRRIPVNMAYNVTAVDKKGQYMTAWLAPDREPIIRRWPISTNHQEKNDWPEYVARAGSVEREQHLATLLGDPMETPGSVISNFLQPPLYQNQFKKAYGTLYTAVYYPWRGHVDYLWPNHTLSLSFDHFPETDFLVTFADASQSFAWDI